MKKGLKIYIPKHAYTNNTHQIFIINLLSEKHKIIQGNIQYDHNNQIWKSADLIIPPTYVTLQTFFKEVELLNKKLITQKVKKAAELAAKEHFGQIRLNGNDYFTGHIIPCTLYLVLVQTKAKDILTEEMLIAMLCHDLLEDSAITHKYITKNFGAKVAKYVKCLTKRSKNSYLDQNNYKLKKDYKTYINASKAEQKEIRNNDYKNQLLEGDYETKVLKCVDRILNLTDDIQNIAHANNKNRVKRYIAETSKYYKVIFEEVAKRNSDYLRLLELLTGIITKYE